MNGESKVVSLEKWQKENARQSPNRVFVQGRSVFIGGVTIRMVRFFAKVDDELFRLSEKAGDSARQAHYFNYMRYLRRQRDEMRERYLQGLTAFYEAFWRNKPLPNLGQTPKERGELALLADEALEESLAINGMVEKGVGLFHKELWALDQRFMALRGSPGAAIGTNPVSPLVLCRLFVAELNGLGLELDIKLLICKIFDRHVLSSFGSVYHDLNALMTKEGVLPDLAKPKQAKRPPMEEARPAVSSQRFGKGGGGDGGADAFKAMRILLEAWRCRLGVSPQASGHKGAMANSAEVLNVLGLLQQASRGSLTTGGGVLSAEQMKRLIARQIAAFHADGKTPPLERQVEDVIDMVGMIFVFILEDSHLPASVKAMLASLQIPVLKIAILDKTFFDQKNHPARLLLNSLAQAGMGLDNGSESENPVYQKIEAVVERILAELDRNVSLFYELLEDFTAFMAIEHRRNRAAEERTRQATQSREHVRQAKKVVAYVIASSLHGTVCPLILKAFLCDAWKDVLVLAWLRRSKDKENWSSAISLMDQLIGVITSPSNAEALRRHKPGEQSLLDAMKSRLESLAYEQNWIMELFKELEICLDERLQGLPVQRQLGSSNRAVEEIVFRDPDFAMLIREIEGNLRGGGNPCKEDADLLRIEEDLVSKAIPAGLQNGDEDGFVGQAGLLEIGQWVEFTEGQHKSRRAKLSWKSRASGLYVFVNAKGAKLLEMRLADLACCLRLGKARIIEDASIPLMDRAISRLMRSLENPTGV